MVKQWSDGQTVVEKAKVYLRASSAKEGRSVGAWDRQASMMPASSGEQLRESGQIMVK